MTDTLSATKSPQDQQGLGKAKACVAECAAECAALYGTLRPRPDPVHLPVVPDTLAFPFPFETSEERGAAGPDPAWLYRYFDAQGAVLYIGVSKHPAIRDEQHWAGHLMGRDEWRVRAVGMRLDLFSERRDALRAENVAINCERPCGNQHNNGLGNADRTLTAAPCGERTCWAAVADYDGWWHPPLPLPLTPAQEAHP